MDLAQLLALLDTLPELDDDALAALADDLAAAMDALLDGNPDDTALADAEAAANGVDAVRAEQATRDQAAAERAERAEALRQRVHAEPEPDPEAEPEGAEPAEAEGADAEPEPAAEPEPLPAAAAVAPAGRLPARTGRVAARGTSRSAGATTASAPPPSMAFPQWGLTAAANAPGVVAGAPVNDYDQLASIFANAYRMITGPSAGPRAHVPLVRAGRGPLAEYGEARYLDGHAPTNAAKVRNVCHPAAITAAGGMCAPVNVAYDMPVVGSNVRPVRDTALTRFGADRGGVRTLVSPVLADVTGAIGFWTNANDLAAVAGTPTKPCLTIDCPDEVESLVQAITQCFKVGNLRQRFFPEQVEAVMRLISTAAARVAETTLLQTMKANSTAVTTAQLLGTSRDVLAYLDAAVAAYRDRWRLDDTERLRFVCHRQLRDAMRADLVRSLPGDPSVNFVVADTSIASWFSARGLNVTWAYEAPSASGHFGAQVAGPLVKFPTSVEALLYPEGAFLFLDGGTLDLGLIRDSTLTATNDLMFFSETFEAGHFQGPESILLTMALCPDGSVSGTADVNPCA
jgi:hypothetical protein